MTLALASMAYARHSTADARAGGGELDHLAVSARRRSDRKRRRPRVDIGKRAAVEAEERLAAATHAADRSGRVTHDEMKVGHGSGDDRSHPTMPQRPTTRSQPITLPAPIVAPSRTSVGRVCSSGSDGRKLDKSGIVARGKAIIREYRAGADHHPVLDRHRGADVDERVDLHAVADADVVGDVGLLTDDAIAPTRAGPRMWTWLQTLVPGPISTSFSTIAVG